MAAQLLALWPPSFVATTQNAYRPAGMSLLIGFGRHRSRTSKLGLTRWSVALSASRVSCAPQR